MDQIVNLVRDICLYILTMLRSLLLLALAGFALAVCLLYLAVRWAVEHPVIWLLLASGFLMAMFLRRYVFGRDIRVERDSAIIVKRVDGEYEPLYQGRHQLNFGDKVSGRLQLRPKSVGANLEEVYTDEEERVRISAVYEKYISDPCSFYLLGRKQEIDFTELNRLVLMAVVENYSFADLYSTPLEINKMVEQTINNQLHDYGWRVINYHMEEVIWPETNEHWKWNRSYSSLQSGHYWSECRNLKRQLW